MLNRVLLIVLTSVTTCGLETAAIARPTWASVAAQRSDADTLVAQLDSEDSNANPAQPSPAIQSLQNRLTELGYYEGPVDGVFTTETRDALAAFQQANGLVGTGILDPLTQQRLVNPEEGGSAPEASSPAPNAGTAPAESGNAPAPSAPALELPPVSESGEVAAPTDENAAPPEASSEPGTAEADTAPSDADPTSSEGGPEATTNGAPEAATPEARRLPFLMILGALIIVIGAAGTGIILWLAKRRRASGDGSIAEAGGVNGEPDSLAMGQPPRYSSMPPSPSPPPLAHPQNGKQPAEPPSPPSSLDVQHQSVPIANSTEPRVAKVNIIDELIQDLHRPDPELRRKAIWELGQRGNSAAVQPLVNLLAEADSHEQSLVLAALAEISSQTLKPINRAVAIALQNENSEVRKNAIRDLTRIYDSLNQVGRMLGHAAVDEDPEVRQTADWALNQLNKLRFNATDTAALLKEGQASRDRLPEDGSSSHSS